MANKADNLATQLRLLPATWEAFCANGVTSQTSLVLGFTYVTPSRQAADALVRALSSTRCAIRAADAAGQQWLIEGESDPMTLSLEKLQAWVVMMVDAGWTFECAFDGFGAQIP